MPYPELFVAPMRQELTDLGVRELRTPADVDAAVTGTAGTLMIVVNSVCGCAAGKARPGIALATLCGMIIAISTMLCPRCERRVYSVAFHYGCHE